MELVRICIAGACITFRMASLLIDLCQHSGKQRLQKTVGAVVGTDNNREAQVGFYGGKELAVRPCNVIGREIQIKVFGQGAVQLEDADRIPGGAQAYAIAFQTFIHTIDMVILVVDQTIQQKTSGDILLPQDFAVQKAVLARQKIKRLNCLIDFRARTGSAFGDHSGAQQCLLQIPVGKIIPVTHIAEQKHGKRADKKASRKENLPRLIKIQKSFPVIPDGEQPIEAAFCM